MYGTGPWWGTVREKRPHYEPIPRPAPNLLEMPLSAILPGINQTVERAGRLVFHSVGDTGGVAGTEMQDAVARAMEIQISATTGNQQPMFFYHLGDVVYFNGVSTDYVPQFYEPYQYYPGPIVAIPATTMEIAASAKAMMRTGNPRFMGFSKTFATIRRNTISSIVLP